MAVPRLVTKAARSASSKTWKSPQSRTVSNCSPSAGSCSASHTRKRASRPRSSALRLASSIAGGARSVPLASEPRAAVLRLALGELDGGRRQIDTRRLEAEGGGHEGVLARPAAGVQHASLEKVPVPRSE